MIVKALHVKNFCSILHERVDCGTLTVLVGRNSTGELYFLRAMAIFDDPEATVSMQGYLAEDTR